MCFSIDLGLQYIGEFPYVLGKVGSRFKSNKNEALNLSHDTRDADLIAHDAR